jgi:hypothetical protein
MKSAMSATHRRLHSHGCVYDSILRLSVSRMLKKSSTRKIRLEPMHTVSKPCDLAQLIGRGLDNRGDTTLILEESSTAASLSLG